VFSALKYGSATVRFMENAIYHLTRAFLQTQRQPRHRAAATVVVVADAVVTVVVVADVPVNRGIANNKEALYLILENTQYQIIRTQN
jgi:hypothetical protein